MWKWWVKIYWRSYAMYGLYLDGFSWKSLVINRATGRYQIRTFIDQSTSLEILGRNLYTAFSKMRLLLYGFWLNLQLLIGNTCLFPVLNFCISGNCSPAYLSIRDARTHTKCYAAASPHWLFTFLTNFKIGDFNKEHTNSLKMIWMMIETCWSVIKCF